MHVSSKSENAEYGSAYKLTEIALKQPIKREIYIAHAAAARATSR
jgi:hypothetical protein